MPRFYDQVPEALASGIPFVLAIISGIKGSSPQKQGAKALFFEDGRIIGTLGGGCLEAEVQRRAIQALRTQTPATFDLVLDHDFGWDDGLICGGKVSGLILPRAAEQGELWTRLGRREGTISWGVAEDFSIRELKTPACGSLVYQETVSPPCALWIAGAGHVAQAVAPLALSLDFDVTVFDDRPALLNSAFFPAGVNCCVGYWEEMLARNLPTKPAFGLIVTRGHQHDALALKHWIQKPFTFLGMIGSKRKARLIFSEFMDDGIATAEQLAQVACPVGLDIHSKSVQEIALSIMAQYVMVRAERVSEVGGAFKAVRAFPSSAEALVCS